MPEITLYKETTKTVLGQANGTKIFPNFQNFYFAVVLYNEKTGSVNCQEKKIPSSLVWNLSVHHNYCAYLKETTCNRNSKIIAVFVSYSVFQHDILKAKIQNLHLFQDEDSIKQIQLRKKEHIYNISTEIYSQNGSL